MMISKLDWICTPESLIPGPCFVESSTASHWLLQDDFQGDGARNTMPVIEISCDRMVVDQIVRLRLSPKSIGMSDAR